MIQGWQRGDSTPANYRVLYRVHILFGLFVFYGLFFNLVGKFGDGESGVNAATVLLQRVVYELILFLNQALNQQRLDQAAQHPCNQIKKLDRKL